MLIEVKAKVAWIIDNKVRKKTETYILDKEVFAQAEYEVMSLLTNHKEEGIVDSFELLGIKVAAVKEIITQFEGEHSFIASLRDTYLQEDGTEKTVKYKVLLWANSISEAMSHTRDIARQGYDLQIDGLREVNYTYINHQDNEQQVSED